MGRVCFVGIINTPLSTCVTPGCLLKPEGRPFTQFEFETCRNVVVKSRQGNLTCSAVAFMIVTLFFIAGEQELVSTVFCI